MGLKDKFGTNRESVEQGAWVDICDNDDGTVCRFRVKRMNQQNPRFQKEIANHRNAFNSDYYSEKQIGRMQASMIEVLINTIIVDWENMEDWKQEAGSFPTDGTLKFMEFTKANLKATLVEFPDLLDLVTLQAQEISNFQAKDAELKNS